MGVIRLSLALALGWCVGCASGHCRRRVEAPGEAQPPEASAPTPIRADKLRSKDHVLVYKYDGGTQCETTPAVSLDDMAKELKGIAILSKSKRNDGLLHISSCGGSTGIANAYEISAKFLPKAEARGFRRWTFESP